MELSKKERTAIAAALLYLAQEIDSSLDSGDITLEQIPDVYADIHLVSLATKIAADAQSLAESVTFSGPDVSFVRAIRGSEFADEFQEWLERLNGPSGGGGGGPDGGERAPSGNVINFSDYLTKKAA